jgi:ABC-type glycerol-3-phosphate transport system permease component
VIVFRNALVSRTRILPAPFILRAGLSGQSWAFGLTLLIVSYLVIVPLITLLYASIKSTEDKLPFETTATTLANYALVFRSPATLPLLLNTLLFTLGSLAIGLRWRSFLPGCSNEPRSPDGPGLRVSSSCR